MPAAILNLDHASACEQQQKTCGLTVRRMGAAPGFWPNVQKSYELSGRYLGISVLLTRLFLMQPPLRFCIVSGAFNSRVERVVRCYFMRDGHIAGVEELPGLSDEEAIQKGRELFEARKTQHAFDGFEVWKLEKMLIQHPAPRPSAEVIPISSKRQA